MASIDLTTLWTIVPVRGLAAGKSRLAPVLEAASRVALNRELLARTLAVVRTWSGTPRRCIVVSPCPDALALARNAGATGVSEGARAVGLNRAARLGVARAVAQRATRVLVLPGDLPFISVEGLSALASAAEKHQIVLAPDRFRNGTNALLFETTTDFEFRFGPKSFAVHLAAAKRAKLTVCVVRRSDLQFDLDTPADLATMQRGRQPPTPGPAPARRRLPFSRRAMRVTMQAEATSYEEE